MHEWALSGLQLRFWIECVRVGKGRSGLQDNIQAVLIFSAKLKLKERAAQSEHHHCRAGERRPW